MDIRTLKLRAIETRKTLLTMIYEAKTGHTGGSLSAADIMVALFFDILRLDPQNPTWEGRDRFILSKGHAIEGYLAVLAERGFIEREELKTFSRYQSRLIGHPSNKVPGIEMNTGALGHGLSLGVGMALGFRKDDKPNKVFVLMGDGEQEEGSIWEAAMAGANYRLDNLVGIVDRNHLQISGKTEDVMNLEPLDERWKSFGWAVRTIDGNDMDQVVRTLRSVPFQAGKPSLVIADTVKGKGVSEMENIAKWHHGVPDEALFSSALAQFEKQKKELEHV